MPLNLALTPTSTCEIFTSTYDAIKNNIIPTTTLPGSHPFRQFWMNHVAALGRPGLYDTVIDALVALTQRDLSWRSKTDGYGLEIVGLRQEMRKVFQHHPPDVVIVSDMDKYGFHLRNLSFWPYIHISEDYVNLWKDADGSLERLGLAVLIAAALDHAIGHWVFTLVSIVSINPN